MRTLHVRLTIGYPTANRHDTIEVDDNATEEQIEEMVREWAHEYIEYSWSEEDED
jgi:NAD-specific glutamate dehydrogenase